jgi:hypothetical protein
MLRSVPRGLLLPGLLLLLVGDFLLVESLREMPGGNALKAEDCC